MQEIFDTFWNVGIFFVPLYNIHHLTLNHHMGAFYKLQLVYGIAMRYNFRFHCEEKGLAKKMKESISIMGGNAKKQYKYFFRLLRDDTKHEVLVQLLDEKGKSISMIPH